MRVLVIGGSGAVGTLVLPTLVQHHDITVFDLKPPAANVAVDYVSGDLRDVDAVRRAVEGIDALVFMAMGPLAGWGQPDNARTHLEVSVAGLYTALNAAHDAGVRHAVYTSSMSVYAEPGELPGRERYPDETVPPDATNFYGLAKRLGEEVCRNAVQAWGMSVVALRLCHPVADHEFPRRDGLAATICTSARDTARAILAALDFQGHGFEAFAISGDGAEKVVSLRKAREVLGWTPLDSTAQATTT
ncbi:NAD-dependent epimerase/dehydratase family protein [Thermasporomyces composti]|uniref:NAD-dependent epimerase/dehydratase family protein n=1 Tax=Thermasporomyces composti TaxID=696763 RepID=A0A3D9VEP2_THECX|nr:NAD(P)-dependent oxidoreductase [Thermasporomyces composti]REF37605.1 NAD-dependent epimerase/dehydratase family protein [Thermasporomyces composti]